jgi:hypothetical protein
MSSFFFGYNPISQRVKTQDVAAEGLIEQLKDRDGLTDRDLQQGRAIIKSYGLDREPINDLPGREFEYHRRDRFTMMEAERDGDVTIKRGFREVGGGRVEQVQFIEERVSDRSTVLKEVRR